MIHFVFVLSLWILLLASAEVSGLYPMGRGIKKHHLGVKTTANTQRIPNHAVLNFKEDQKLDRLDPEDLSKMTRIAQSSFIREVKDNDVSSVVSLRVRVFYPELKSMAQFHARICEKLRNRIAKKGSTCLAAFRDDESGSEMKKASTTAKFGNILGTIEVSSSDFGGTAMENVGSERKLYCCDLAVQECMRRKGLATKLLRGVEEHALREGYDELYLHVEQGNKAAEALYLREGYRIIPSLSWAVAFTESHLQKNFDKYLFLWKRLGSEMDLEVPLEREVAKDSQQQGLHGPRSESIRDLDLAPEIELEREWERDPNPLPGVVMLD